MQRWVGASLLLRNWFCFLLRRVCRPIGIFGHACLLGPHRDTSVFVRADRGSEYIAEVFYVVSHPFCDSFFSILKISCAIPFVILAKAFDRIALP